MFPPSQSLTLDVEAISGICGSISIACWIVVFSPQIIENFRRSSAEGLSIPFLVIWLAGDVFNILGAALQGVLPTMIILAVYYTLADIVLLLQCFYYRGFTLKDEVKKPTVHVTAPSDDETAPLLAHQSNANGTNGQRPKPTRSTSPAFHERITSVAGHHLSPATPLHGEIDEDELSDEGPGRARTAIQKILFNLTAILLVCAAGVFGWWLSYRSMIRQHQGHHHKIHHEEQEPLQFNVLGQVFGYICAVLYLGSRVPQLLLNYRRQSTEGISMLFFLFACIGNLTYVLSIVAYDPNMACKDRHCPSGKAGPVYLRYMAVNFSWLLGSFGTLFLDAAVFWQYFLYRKEDPDNASDEAAAIGN